MPPGEPTKRPPSQMRQHLLDRLAPVVEGCGADLEDVSVSSAGRRSVVRVIVDADGGVDLDAVADISRAIGEALDESDAIPGTYVLEVSSPGVDRPLTEPRHWRRAAGRLVTTTVDGAEVTARIVEATEAGVVLDGRGLVTWDSVGRGKVQVEFSRPGEPDEEEED